MDNLTEYLSGKKLYGDDFTVEELKNWYKDEEEGYANLGARDRSTYRYMYHALNRRYGFKYLDREKYDQALGFGSAYGDEFLPLKHRIEHLTIVDPSSVFASDTIHGIPCRYIKPTIEGILPFQAETFDLITCLSALSHIPNVSTIIHELSRCLRKNGTLLLRDAIVSMGNWSEPRPGLTRRMRGVPLDILLKIIEKSGLIVHKKSFCVFPPFSRLFNRTGVAPYNSAVITRLDGMLSTLFRWNARYHAIRFYQKFRPVSVYFVLRKAHDA